MHFKKIVLCLSILLATLFSVQLSYSQAVPQVKHMHQGKLFDTAANTDSDYLMAIERANEALESAYSDTEFGGKTRGLMSSIDQSKDRLNLILSSLKDASANVRNQQMYRVMLQELQVELEDQNKQVNTKNEALKKIQLNIYALRKDTIFMSLIRDTVRRKQFSTELVGLKSRYLRTDSLMKLNMRIMSTKKRLVVDNRMTTDNALLTVEKTLQKSGITLLGNEYPYLWQAGSTMSNKEPSQSIKGKWDVERKVVSYYSSYALRGLITLALLTALFWWYIRRNLNYLKAQGLFKNLEQLNFKYLNKNSKLSVIVLGLNVAIITNLYAPAFFIELLQLTLLTTLTLLFRNNWSKNSMRNWLYLSLLFIALCFMDLFVKVSFVERSIFIVINVLAIYYGSIQLKSIQDQLYIKGLLNWAKFIFISLNAFSLFANLFGRVSVSHTLSLAAIISLTQIIALSIFLKIILEIILLQIYTTRTKRGIGKLFDHESLSDTLKKPFVVLISYMWIIVIASNLNIWEALHTHVAALLRRPITIGSVTFTLGGVLLFFVIVWLAHLLQKYVAYFFGEVDENDNIENINKRQHSKLLVTRLVVLIVGYLLAVAASGMPMDKLSIVIGALGVGVGLGLQNIVTNFVSGVILIFDRPIQVGDIIEVSSQSGRVKSMGLRSTKINSDNGAEIIIPNGNILSQNITNWTYTDNLKQVEITFTITGDIDPEQVNKTILGSLKNVPLVDGTRTPQIFYNSVSEGNYKLLVKYWCSIYRTEEVLSNTRQALFSSFKDKGIALSI